jgi:hypothetical protein
MPVRRRGRKDSAVAVYPLPASSLFHHFVINGL